VNRIAVGKETRLKVLLAVFGLALGMALPNGALAGTLSLDFSTFPEGDPPAEFRATLTGDGPQPVWRVVAIEDAPRVPDPDPTAAGNVGATVIAQVSTDPTDERFPLLIYEPQEFGDFTAQLTFRTVSGKVEQMAGLAFRLKDEKNYYVLRASSLGRTFRFYKVVNGQRSNPIGPRIEIPSGTWHTLEVTCKGNAIQCKLNDREVIPTLNDSSFSRGKLALWTKSDSVSQFRRLHVTYTAFHALPQRMVAQAIERYPRLLAVTVFERQGDDVLAVASSDPARVGTKAQVAERQALESGRISAGTARDHSAAVFPMRDRNGDPRFALHLKMRTFPGQTDNNVAARGRVVASYLEKIVRSADASGE
jgi:hypothetical protein